MSEILVTLCIYSASSVASSDPIVSTDGLGSSMSFNSTVTSVEEKPFRPSFARKWGMKIV